MELDDDKAHKKVASCVTTHLIEGVQQVDQNVSTKMDFIIIILLLE